MNPLILASLLAGSAFAQFSDEAGPAKAAGKAQEDASMYMCTMEQQQVIRASIGSATEYLGRRIAGLKEELERMEKSGPDAAPALQETLYRHFKVPKKLGSHKNAARQVLHVYEGMYGYLTDQVRWPLLSCEDDAKNCKGGTVAYTWSSHGQATRFCPPFFAKGASSRARAATIIHEMAHRQVPTDMTDFDETGYYNPGGTTPLGMSDSFKNSDSYANFAVDEPAKTAAKKK